MTSTSATFTKTAGKKPVKKSKEFSMTVTPEILAALKKFTGATKRGKKRDEVVWSRV